MSVLRVRADQIQKGDVSEDAYHCCCYCGFETETAAQGDFSLCQPQEYVHAVRAEKGLVPIEDWWLCRFCSEAGSRFGTFMFGGSDDEVRIEQALGRYMNVLVRAAKGEGPIYTGTARSDQVPGQRFDTAAKGEGQ